MDKYIIFDLETTSLNSKKAEIIEIAAIRIQDGKVVDEFSSFVKPDNGIDPIASSVNGITYEMVADSPRLSEVLPKFLDFIGNDPLLGYNISSFDLPILRRFAKELLHVTLQDDYYDILWLARDLLSFLPSRRLTAIATYFGLSEDGAHRALNDCYLTFECYKKLSELDTRECPHPKPAVSQKKYIHNHSENTKALQTLQSFLLEITADNVLTSSEILNLKSWLDKNVQLKDQYPFDRVFSVVQAALADGFLEQSELDHMLSLFKQYTDPIMQFDTCNDSLELTGKNVCLTGNFDYGSRSTVETLFRDCGCNCQSVVSGKTDYVIVGSLGSPDWSHNTYGSKVKKAMELIGKGKKIQILKEKDVLCCLRKQGAIS